ncbi:MAG: NepR family anti-sigma factor [Gemmobacter sp.]|nr:NepR family anti-sigma factor [Gemmobacter sp.]
MSNKKRRSAGDGVKPTPALAREIDENLKRVYREILVEEVPDRFTALLEALKAKETEKKSDGS